MSLQRAFLAALITLAPATAFAHHGQDFLIVESPSVAHPGDVYFLANAEAALESDVEEQAGFEPAVLVGIAPRVALELHAHTEKLTGEDWSYEATAPSVHVLLTDPERHDGLKAGLSAEYEIARETDAANRLELRLSLEQRINAYKWGGNLIYSREQDGDGEFGLAMGLRRAIGERLALGVEAQGAFDHAEGRELLGGLYWELGETVTLKFGLGGIRDDAGGTTALARIGVVVRLRD
ncbi:hypothetical protein [Lysobacter fragariae]